MSDSPTPTPSCLSTPQGRIGVQTWVVGSIGAGVGYGIVCILSFQCIFFLSRSLFSAKEQRMRNMVLMLYTTAMLALGTLAIGADASITWGGILGARCFELKDMNPFNTLGSVGSIAFILCNWAADGILIWRYLGIYQGCNSIIYLLGARPLIAILFTYIVVEGVILMRTTSGLSGPISYVAVSMTLNILITIMIVGRLFYLRRCTIRTLGSEEAKRFHSIINMILESAALIVIFDLLYLVPYMSRSPVLNIPLQCIVYVQIIAPLLIIQRVALKKAWTYGSLAAKGSEGKSEHV